MPVEIGENLRHYRITAKLGAGGMGEVYRAKDSLLGREVAIKILPEEFAGDSDRLGRFEREAKVLASMNHPHIAQIYGLEEDQERRFLVLELVEGTTLAERIRRGPIPVEEAILIALQIAEALEAAHGRGIIHRDLKPANIMLTADGEAKVLDFGIAKPLATASTEDEAETHTLTTPPTRAGVVIGTPTYMSPEQARGQGVDRRSDIWAFGVVLWEMLTGARLFEGRTDSDILLAVIQVDPDWQELPPGTPPAVRRLLRRCLERDPSNRLHDIADARLEIEETFTQPDDVSTAESLPTLRARALMAWPVIIAAVAVTAVLAGGAVWKLTGSRTASPGAPIRVALNLPPEVVLEREVDWRLAISPDGRSLVFVAKKGGRLQLYRRELDQFEAIPIPGTEDGINPFVSPDGRWLGFFAGAKLKKVRLGGGTPQVLADAPGAFGATWGADENIIFAPEVGEGLWRIPASGGTPELLLRPDFDAGESDLFWPELLPDGKAVLFTAWRGFTAETTEIGVLDLELRTRKTLIENASYARYLPTGHLIFGSGAGVQVVPFDVDRREITGPPVPVPEHIAYDEGLGQPHLAVSDGGCLAFIPGSGTAPKFQLMSVDLEGRETPLTETRRAYMYPKFSPDGKRLAVTIFDPADVNVWILDLSTGTQTKLTLESESLFPLWTPDGERVAFASYRGGELGIYWKRADGSGEAEPLVSPDHAGELLAPSSWSPDGKTLAFWKYRLSGGEPGQYDLWVTDIGGDREPRPLVVTEAHDFGAAISPDGRWIVYVSDESGRSEIFVQPFPGGGERYQISTEEGEKPIWSPDGRTLYFIDPFFRKQLFAVSVSTMHRFQAQAPRILFESHHDLATYRAHPNFDIAPDGKSFVMVTPDEEWGNATEIRVIFNWFEELERLAPADETR